MRCTFRILLLCSLLTPFTFAKTAKNKTKEVKPVASDVKRVTNPNGTDTIENEQVARILVEAFIQKKEYQRAQKYLSLKQTWAPKSPVYSLLAGRLAIATGQNELAAKNFTESANLAKSQSREVEEGEARYATAETLLNAGKKENALLELSNLKGNCAVADNIDTAINAAQSGSKSLPPLSNEQAVRDCKSSQGKWNFNVSLESGYDTNVTLLPNSGGDMPTSFFIRPTAGVNYKRQLMNRPLSLGANASYSNNFADAAKSSNSLPLGLNGNWQLPSWLGEKHALFIQDDIGLVYLTQNDFRLFSISESLTPMDMYKFGQDQALVVKVPLSYTKYPNFADPDDRSGFGLAASVDHLHNVWNLKLTEGIAIRHEFASGDNFKLNGVGLSLGVGLPDWKEIKSNVRLGFDYSSYPSSANSRADSKLSAMLVAVRTIGMVDLGFSYLYENNGSNIAAYQYNKHIIALRVSHEF